MKRIFVDKSLLENLYVKEQKTIRQISAELNIDTRVVVRNLKECGIRLRGNKKLRISKDILTDLYIEQKMSTRQIAQKLDANEGMVRTSLKEHDIKQRNKSWKSSQNKNGKIVSCEFCDKKIYRKKSLLEKSLIFFCSWDCSKEFQAVIGSSLPESWRRRRGYKQWRKSILKRDMFLCKLCKSKKDLVAHHIVEAQDNPDLRLEISNGITLCKNCHIKIHRNDSHNYIESLQEAILVENPNIGENLEIDNTEG